MTAALTKVERVWLDGRELSYEQAGGSRDQPRPLDGDRVLRIIVTGAGRRLVTIELFAPPPPEPTLLPVEHRPSPLMVRVKSLSYGAHMLATRIAREAGCWEAVFVDPVERVVTEAPVSSFVWAEGSRVLTPPLGAGILDSITRTLLLEARERWGAKIGGRLADAS